MGVGVLLIIKLGAWYRWVVSFTRRFRYSGE